MAEGRPPKPTALKLLSGTDRPDRVNRAEPKPASDQASKPPSFLSRRAWRFWRELAPVLAAMRVLTDADRHALALGCDALADYLAYHTTIRREGATYTTTTVQGDTMHRPRPEVVMASDAWRRAEAMLAKLGMTPSDRSRVHAEVIEEEDPLDKLLRETS